MRYPHLLLSGTYRRQLMEAELRSSMTALVTALGVTPVDEAFVTCQDHRWGPSVFQALEESHAVFHYFDRATWFFDLFTCQQFSDDAEVAWELNVYRELYARFEVREVTERLFHWRTAGRA